MVFPSKDAANRCRQYLHKSQGPTITVQEVSFSLNQKVSEANRIWACFSAILFSEQYSQCANEFWADMGDGISSRNAEFCLERFPFLSSVSSVPDLQSRATRHDCGMIPPEPWHHSDTDTKKTIKTVISKLVTPSQPRRETVSPEDVYLFPKGMCAIHSLASILVPGPTKSSGAIVFGLVITSFCYEILGSTENC